MCKDGTISALHIFSLVYVSIYAKPFLFYHIFKSVLKLDAMISAVLFLFDITLSIWDFL